MKQLIIIGIVFLGCINSDFVRSQSTFILKLKVSHIKTGLLPNYAILINGQQTNTDGMGFVNLALNENRTYVNVELLNSTNNSILYPLRGHLSIPKDGKEILEIIIGTQEDNTLLQKKYFSVIQKLITDSNKLITESSKQNFDSLAGLIQKLEYKNITLEREKIIQEEKNKLFIAINNDLTEFKLRAANLKIELANTAQFAYTNGLVSNKISVAINDYNNIFNNLTLRRAIYAHNINDYWKNDFLTANFKSLIGYALDTLHETKILKLMVIIRQINEYRQRLINREKIPSSQKKEIQQSIETELISLDPMITELSIRTNDFILEFSK